MYHKPRVQRFGTVRELTQVGFTGASDGYTITGPVTGNGDNYCGAPGGAVCPTTS
jgi:hypothetical protein